MSKRLRSNSGDDKCLFEPIFSPSKNNHGRNSVVQESSNYLLGPEVLEKDIRDGKVRRFRF